jgi:hypothetical protein
MREIRDRADVVLNGSIIEHGAPLNEEMRRPA